MSITCGFWKLRSFKAPGRQKLVASAGGAAWLGPFAERVTVHGWALTAWPTLTVASFLVCSSLPLYVSTLLVCVEWNWSSTFVWYPWAALTYFLALWGEVCPAGDFSLGAGQCHPGDGWCRPDEAFFLPQWAYSAVFCPTVLLKFLMWTPGLSQNSFCSWISNYNYWSFCRDRCWGLPLGHLVDITL